MDDAAHPPLAPTTDVDTFFRADLRVGTIVRVEAFPEARTPAWKLWVDFGAAIGVRASSARLTELYRAEDLHGRQVVALVNVPPRRIGPFVSECLITGFDTPHGVVLTTVERPVPNGARLY
ncbi:MAG: tRNA-binding protein [Trueperaceae bacterium]|nr:tRNA-binding protein [Trueperaceae bacterium]